MVYTYFIILDWFYFSIYCRNIKMYERNICIVLLTYFLMFKKFIFPAFLLWIFSCWLSYADFRENENGKNIAQQYLESHKNDDFWENNSPKLWEWTPLYMEKTTPSYFEYQVICERNIDCGFIIVNIDWDDVDIPIASPSDIPPTKILVNKSWDIKENSKFYYFGIFEIYSKHIITGQVQSIDPQYDFTVHNEDWEKMTNKEKEDVENIQKEIEDFLLIKLLGHIKYWDTYRDSENFRKIKNNIQKYNILWLPWFEDDNNTNWRYVKWINSTDCVSRIPCYQQFDYNYQWIFDKKCKSWCSPVAAAMIFAYHDKEYNYSNLFQDTVAPMKNKKTYYWWDPNINPKTVIDEIRWYMDTYCVIDFRRPNNTRWGATLYEKIPQGIKFAQNNWYPWSQSWQTFIQSEIYPRIQQEINNGRPLLLNIDTKWYDSWAKPNINPLDTYWKTTWHTIVWYGYKKINNTSYQVRINAGWGDQFYSNINISLFNITNIDLSDPEYSTYSYPTITNNVVWYHISQ